MIQEVDLCLLFAEHQERPEAVPLLRISRKWKLYKGKPDASLQGYTEQQAATDHNSPLKHYLQVLFVVVVHNSQEERHEDVSVDDDKGNEEQGIPRAEVKCRHPRKEDRDCYLLGRQTGK